MIILDSDSKEDVITMKLSTHELDVIQNVLAYGCSYLTNEIYELGNCSRNRVQTQEELLKKMDILELQTIYKSSADIISQSIYDFFQNR